MLRRRAEEARQREARREDGTAQGRRGRGKNPSGAKRDWQGSRQWYQPSQRDQPPQGRPSPNEWAEIAPCPNRTSGPSRLTRCTIGIPGIAPVSSFSLRLPRSADIPKFPARWRGASPQRYVPGATVDDPCRISGLTPRQVFRLQGQLQAEGVRQDEVAELHLGVGLRVEARGESPLL